MSLLILTSLCLSSLSFLSRLLLTKLALFLFLDSECLSLFLLLAHLLEPLDLLLFVAAHAEVIRCSHVFLLLIVVVTKNVIFIKLLNVVQLDSICYIVTMVRNKTQIAFHFLALLL